LVRLDLGTTASIERTVNNSSNSPQQQYDKDGGCLLSLLTGHAAQKYDVDRERRTDDDGIEYLHTSVPSSYWRSVTQHRTLSKYRSVIYYVQGSTDTPIFFSF